jgi:hypothetical protein
MSEKTKSSKAETKDTDVSSKISSAYIDFILTNGKKPVSVYEFVKKLKIDEQEFYKFFSSFEALEKSIWAGFIQSTLDSLAVSQEYQTFPAKEKLLSFYYTYVEVLKRNRSFISASMDKGPEMLWNNTLSKARDVFKVYVSELLAEATESGEVKQRPYISDKYPEGLWLQLLFVTRFWIKDDSTGFEKTDAAIEKALKVSFDLMGPGALDSLVDMAKFLYQNK